jgi:hypothetical protein
VVLDSDYAFTVTNVLVHGIPYLALVWRYGRGRFRGTSGALGRVFHARGWPLFLATLVAAAWLENGAGTVSCGTSARCFPRSDFAASAAALALLVPLLALPQATHYLLDAWIWRRKGNPGLADRLGFD